MPVNLDFEECLRDSPWFRAAVEEAEADVAELETQLEKLRRLSSAALDAGRHLAAAGRALAAALRDLARGGEPPVREALEKASEALEQMMESHEELQDSTQAALHRHIHPLLKEGGRGLRDARREWERASEALQGALQHHAEVPRRRPLEAREAEAALGGARGAARARGLDYVLQINMIQEKKKTEILHFVLALLEAQATFFSQGHHRATSTQQYRGQLGVQLDRMELEGARKQRDMEQRHAVLRQQDLSQETVGGATGEPAPGAPPMQGYLYKRASNAFRTWSRRWFSIQSNQLVYLKRARDPPTVLMQDLRLCTVRACPDLERSRCFEVLSPSKSCVLQADSSAQQRRWLQALQSGIASAFSGGGAPSPPGQPPEGLDPVPGLHGDPSGCSVLETVLRVPGNRSCCECREPEPAWASVNLGITLCIQCSGIHRSLGVHFSKVRSLTLDSWEPELVKLMCELGNSALNRIYEARVEEMGVKRPPPGCSRPQREEWIRAKYVHKKFLPRPLGAPLRPRPPRPGHAPEPPPSLHPGALLYWAAQRQLLPTMAEALAHGADPGWANGAEGNSTPLLQAVAANSLLACEFLLQNGASVNQSDGRGQGPLHHATLLGYTGLACLFLKRGADVNAMDADGKDPLSIAMDLANADIVTLLRLAKMREMDMAQGQTDDTFLDVFRDISLMASDHPEKLTRPHGKLSTL